MKHPLSPRNQISRRTKVATTAVVAASSPALAQAPDATAAQVCQVGPPPHHKGPSVFLDYDQVELDASYDQAYYEPLIAQVSARLASNSAAMRARIGAPQRATYGPTEIEKLDIYRTKRTNAPVFVFIHGGNWASGAANDFGFPAEMFVNAGAHFVALDFIAVQNAGGDLRVMAAQVQRGIAWVYKNAANFGGDPNQIYVGGHSSGGHLCGVALVADWQKEFGLPDNIIKGGLCMSGMYEMAPVRLSWRRTYVKFTDAMADAMSSQRHIDKLHAPLIVTYGTYETPEFQRQSRDFAAAVKAVGKPVQLLEATNYAHLEMVETLGNPYGPNGRAALALMKLAAADN
jgi:arylformamidase